jgi:hypothetical protein
MDHRVPSAAIGPRRSTAILALVTTFASVFAPVGARASEARNPPQWDIGVVELVEFVERTRGLTFKRAVPVRFLTESEFTKEITTDQGELTKKQKRDLEQQAELLRAIGLIRADAGKLLEGANATRTARTLAIYDHDKKVVYVRGRQLDVATKVILVHELTHVLQDQHFGLEKLHKRSPSGSATRALVEGDAVRIEHEYRSTLSQADREAVDAETKQKNDEAMAQVPVEPPAALQIMHIFQYSVGRTFVEAIASERENKGVDDAFRNPPKSSKQVLNPGAYLDRDRPARVPAPKLRAGEKRVGKPDTFGAFQLYLMLSGRLDPSVALSTIGNWGGASAVQFEGGPNACVRVALTGKTPESTEWIAATLEQWAALGPGGSASVARAKGRVTVTACDHGAAADDAKIRSAGNVLGIREFIIFDQLDTGVPLSKLVCMADRVAVASDLTGGFWVQGATGGAQQLISSKLVEASNECPA